MEKNNKNQKFETLDPDILELLAESQPDVELDDQQVTRMRNKLMMNIHQEKASQKEAFLTVKSSTEEGWIEALPGAKVKILQGDITLPNSLLSYLVRLEPGFNMQGHDHPFDEETLMLEGDLTLGDIQLTAGDFHFVHAGTTHGDVSTKDGCLAYMRGALPV